MFIQIYTITAITFFGNLWFLWYFVIHCIAWLYIVDKLRKSNGGTSTGLQPPHTQRYEIPRNLAQNANKLQPRASSGQGWLFCLLISSSLTFHLIDLLLASFHVSSFYAVQQRACPAIWRCLPQCGWAYHQGWWWHRQRYRSAWGEPQPFLLGCWQRQRKR